MLSLLSDRQSVQFENGGGSEYGMWRSVSLLLLWPNFWPAVQCTKAGGKDIGNQKSWTYPIISFMKRHWVINALISRCVYMYYLEKSKKLSLPWLEAYKSKLGCLSDVAAAATTHSYKQFILLCLNIVEPAGKRDLRWLTTNCSPSNLAAPSHREGFNDVRARYEDKRMSFQKAET